MGKGKRLGGPIIQSVHSHASAHPIEYEAATEPLDVVVAEKGLQMSATLTTFGIDKLNSTERLRLIGEIWDSIASETEAAPISEEMKQEIDHRLAAHRANPDAAVPWEQVEAAALQRLRK